MRRRHACFSPKFRIATTGSDLGPSSCPSAPFFQCHSWDSLTKQLSVLINRVWHRSGIRPVQFRNCARRGTCFHHRGNVVVCQWAPLFLYSTLVFFSTRRRVSGKDINLCTWWTRNSCRQIPNTITGGLTLTLRVYSLRTPPIKVKDQKTSRQVANCEKYKSQESCQSHTCRQR